jgi:hypothetical protein
MSGDQETCKVACNKQTIRPFLQILLQHENQTCGKEQLSIALNDPSKGNAE